MWNEAVQTRTESKAVVIQRFDERCYEVETDTETYRRNRVDLKEQPVPLKPQPAEPIQTKDQIYGSSAYLDLTGKNASRKALTKLRISSQKLLIET